MFQAIIIEQCHGKRGCGYTNSTNLGKPVKPQSLIRAFSLWLIQGILRHLIWVYTVCSGLSFWICRVITVIWSNEVPSEIILDLPLWYILQFPMILQVDSKDIDQTAQLHSLISAFAIYLYPKTPFPVTGLIYFFPLSRRIYMFIGAAHSSPKRKTRVEKTGMM